MNATIKIGDTVVTGGMSSYFPLGIPVGTISSFDRNSKNDFYTIDVDLFEDPSQVYYVYILRNEDREEINTLKQDISK
jgi:rod shape-determining protein MreC